MKNPQLSEGTREIISERSSIMKKDIKFSTRMASADREKIKALAAKTHMSMSDYVTACCLGKRIVVIDANQMPFSEAGDNPEAHLGHSSVAPAGRATPIPRSKQVGRAHV